MPPPTCRKRCHCSLQPAWQHRAGVPDAARMETVGHVLAAWCNTSKSIRVTTSYNMFTSETPAKLNLGLGYAEMGSVAGTVHSTAGAWSFLVVGLRPKVPPRLRTLFAATMTRTTKKRPAASLLNFRSTSDGSDKPRQQPTALPEGPACSSQPE